jgi:hypothetical protein
MNELGLPMETKYTIVQIKKAYFATFHEAGEIFFNYLATPEENLKATEAEWLEFFEELEKVSNESDT